MSHVVFEFIRHINQIFRHFVTFLMSKRERLIINENDKTNITDNIATNAIKINFA